MQALTLLFLGIVALASDAVAGGERQASLFGPAIHEARPTDLDAQQTLLTGIRDHLRQADPRLRAVADLDREEEKLEALLSHLAQRRTIPEEHLDAALRQFDRREQATLDALGREYRRAVFLAFPRDRSAQDRHFTRLREVQNRGNQNGGVPVERAQITAWLLEAIEAVSQRPPQDLPPLAPFDRFRVDDLVAHSAPLPISRQVVPTERVVPPPQHDSPAREVRGSATPFSALARRTARLRTFAEAPVPTPAQPLPASTHGPRRAASPVPIPRPTQSETDSTSASLQHGLLALPDQPRVVPERQSVSRSISPLPVSFHSRLRPVPIGSSAFDVTSTAPPTIEAAPGPRTPATGRSPVPKQSGTRGTQIAPPIGSSRTIARNLSLSRSIPKKALAGDAGPSACALPRIVRQPRPLSFDADDLLPTGLAYTCRRTVSVVDDHLPTEARPQRLTSGPWKVAPLAAGAIPHFERQVTHAPETAHIRPPLPTPAPTVLSHTQPRTRKDQVLASTSSLPKPRWNRARAARCPLASPLAQAAMPTGTSRQSEQASLRLVSRCTTAVWSRERAFSRPSNVSLATRRVDGSSLRVESGRPVRIVAHTGRADRNPIELLHVHVSTVRAPIERAAFAHRLSGTAFVDPADLHVASPADHIDLEQLRSRIAGCNLELAELRTELNAPVPWTIDRLAALISRLQLLSARQGDLALLYGLLPPDRRTGMNPVESTDAIVQRLASGVAAAREAAKSGIRSSARSDPAVDLMILEELARALTAIAER